MGNRRNDFWSIAPLTMIFMVLCSGVYLYSLVLTRNAGPDNALGWGGVASPVLIRLGASFRPTLWDGGWYCLVMPMFLHGNLLHILCNMYTLFQIGPSIEVHFGTYNYGTLYLLSGLGGVCASMIFGGHLSVGASGCLFGLMGAFLAVRIFAAAQYGRVLRSPEVRKTAFHIALLFGVIYFLIPNVDNWGHLGGLIFGLAFGSLFEYWRKSQRMGWALVLLALLLVGGGVAASRWMIFSPEYHLFLGHKASQGGDWAEAERRLEEAQRWKGTFPSEELEFKFFLLEQRIHSSRNPPEHPS